MSLPNWTSLLPGRAASTDVVIAIDFESASRDEPGFGAMARHLDLPFDFIQPKPEALPGHARGSVLVDTLAEDVRRSTAPVRAVLGYCAGGAIACRLAVRLVGRPPLFLVDPMEVDGGMISYQFRESVEQLRGMAPDEEIESARRIARDLCRDNDWTSIGESLPLLYHGLVARGLADMGATGVVDELAERYRSYLNYLLTAQQFGYASARPEDVAVLAADSDPLVGFAGQATRLDLSRQELFTDPRVIRVARDVLLRAG